MVVISEPAQAGPPAEGSEYIRWVQNTLNQVMNLRLPVDGIIGLETRSAIRDFQRREGLIVDGIAGPDTKEALSAARRRLARQPLSDTTNGKPAREPAQQEEGQFFGLRPHYLSGLQREIVRTSKTYVQWVQQALNRILGLQLAVDGISGPMTRSAIRSFQQKNGLVVDGIVGSQTERALIAAGAGNPPRVGSSPYVLPSAPSQPSTGAATSAQLARQIINSGRASFLTYHTSGCGKGDRADANSNINDTANSLTARRSGYDCSSSLPAAPGGSVSLNDRMLNGMLNLSQSYTFRVTEIAGGQHSGTSRHYAGVAFDVDLINGVRVNSSNPHYQAFMQRCRALGATEVLGPGSTGHSTHIHCAWPRP